MFTSNYVINTAHLHSYINLQNVKIYKNPDNAQVTIISLRNIVLTVSQIKSQSFCFYSLLTGINFKNIFVFIFDVC